MMSYTHISQAQKSEYVPNPSICEILLELAVLKEVTKENIDNLEKRIETIGNTVEDRGNEGEYFESFKTNITDELQKQKEDLLKVIDLRLQQIEKLCNQSDVSEKEIDMKIKRFTEDSKFIRFLMDKSMHQIQQFKADFKATLEKQIEENNQSTAEIDGTKKLLKKQSEANEQLKMEVDAALKKQSEDNEQLKADIYAMKEILEKRMEDNEQDAVKAGHMKAIEKFRHHSTQNAQAITFNTESSQESTVKFNPGR